MTDLYTAKYIAKLASAELGKRVEHHQISKWSLHGVHGLMLPSVQVGKGKRFYRKDDALKFIRELKRAKAALVGRPRGSLTDEQVVRRNALLHNEDDNHRYAAWRKHDERINGGAG